MNDEKSNPAISPPKQRARRLRIIGVVILILGIASAGIVYWIGTRSADLSDDPSMAGYSKPENQQMERLYGKWGDISDDFFDDLKQPGTQAIIIAVVAVIIASSCFYFARLSDYDDEMN